MQPLAEILSADAYRAERLDPQPGQSHYLCLADLRQSVARLARSVGRGARILDYGCGGSPYRDLFDAPSAYVRADIPGEGGAPLDLVIRPGVPLAAESQSFDLVLSTQVAEHVEDVAGYFDDAFRLLKPGGSFYVSTHGHYAEHGAPHDYWRWTADGLAIALRRAGFVVERTEKLTTGLRALLTFVELALFVPLPPKTSAFGFAWRVLRKLHGVFRASVHRACDRWLTSCGVVERDLADHRLYVGVVVVARKPS